MHSAIGQNTDARSIKSADGLNLFNQHSVSIIIVNYNGLNWLKACLESVRCLEGVITEVIVVDNASTDGSMEALCAYPWVKVVQSDQNLGFAGGNNLGLRDCSFDYVLLLNNDTVIVPNFLQPLCDYLDQHPEVGVVQGKMQLPRFGGALDVCGSYLTWLGLPYHYGFYKTDQPQYQHSRPVFSGKGACLMFRRDIIKRIGGFLFDDSFFCYYEESDFCHRVWLAGWEVHFVATTPIQHFMGATAGGPQAGFVLRHYLRNMTFSLLSNLSIPSLFRIMPFFFSVQLASAAISVITFRKAQFQAHLESLLLPFQKFKAIIARRKLIKIIRRRSDGDLFARTMINPRMGYFVKTFTGQLAQYYDNPLPSSHN
ncbi:MAG: glycosyltransferase family 2 protein [Limisphaerales bacterium]